jgi:hypothetical protein
MTRSGALESLGRPRGELAVHNIYPYNWLINKYVSAQTNITSFLFFCEEYHFILEYFKVLYFY